MSNDLSFMDSILSQMNQDVNQKMDTLFGVVEEMKESYANSVPRFLDDPSIQSIAIEKAEKVSYAEALTPIAEISQAFNKLRERGEQNKLTDSFRNQETKETRSRTERSFTQTLTSYSRYISLLATAN